MQFENSEYLDVLPESQRLFIDVMRTTACQAQTHMVPAVANTQGKKANPSKALQALFKADAHIVVDHANGLLNVQILGLDNNCADRALKPFIDELSATETM